MKRFLVIPSILIFAPLLYGQVEIKWENFSAQQFQRAKKENKIILLNLEANWCHWCHVMHDSTYANTKIVDYLNSKFIAVKADQDANPELAARYKDYGWPATVFLNAEGEDLVKRRGYIPPDRFLRLLKSIIADPTPEENTDEENSKNGAVETKEQFFNSLEQNFLKSLDYEKGGFDQAQKFVENDTYEYAVFGSSNSAVKQWTAISIEGAKQLSDPAWGGIYQYSTHNDWKHQHYEKLLSIQARYIRLFVLNYLYNDDTSSLRYAEKCVEYIDRFLKSENGLYFNAQDADLKAGEHAEYYFKLSDEQRLNLGIPRIDQNTYTHNNAEIAQALMHLYQATMNSNYLNQSKNIINQLLSSRKSSNGLFKHSHEERGIFSLRDNLAVADALTQFVKFFPNDTIYSNELGNLLSDIKNEFLLSNGSFQSFAGNNGLKPLPIISENIRLARLLNWYGKVFEIPEYNQIAKNCFSFLCTSGIVDANYSEPALLMLRKELNNDPQEYVLMTVNLAPSELEAKMKALAPFYSNFRVHEKEHLPQEKREYFEAFNENVLLICTSNACSMPMYSPSDILNEMKRTLHFRGDPVE